jgi:hypothetical protein
LAQVGLPAQVVDVELGAVGIKVEDLVDDRIEQVDVVRDDDETALVALEVVAQPGDRVGVEVIGRLVEEQSLGAREEDARQFDAAPLTTGEGPERLVELPLGQTQSPGDLRGLGLRGIPAGSGELGVEPGVAPHGALLLLACLGGHRRFGRTQVPHDLIQPPSRQDPIPRRHVEVARARILGQVAHVTGSRDRPGGRQGLARQRLGQGRLAGTVAPDQPDPIPRGDAEGRCVEQEVGAGPQFDGGSGDHGRALGAVDVEKVLWRRHGDRATRGKPSTSKDGLV